MEAKKTIISVLSGLQRAAHSIPKVKSVALQVRSSYRPEAVVKRMGKSYRFSAPAYTPYWRALTMFDKEPETIEWIDGFDEGDVLYDVGANVGIYTIYAAAQGKVSSVYAFEPESQNFALLNENIYLNGLAEKVECLCVAIAGTSGLGRLHLSKFSPGEACHSFGEQVDYNRNPMDSPYSQSSISFTLDGFIEGFVPRFPNHLKIDVDGLESAIISGAAQTLRDPRLKSIQVELNDRLDSDAAIPGIIEGAGFELKWRRRSEMFEGTQYTDIYNYVFARRPSARP